MCICNGIYCKGSETFSVINEQYEQTIDVVSHYSKIPSVHYKLQIVHDILLFAKTVASNRSALDIKQIHLAFLCFLASRYGVTYMK